MASAENTTMASITYIGGRHTHDLPKLFKQLCDEAIDEAYDNADAYDLCGPVGDEPHPYITMKAALTECVKVAEQAYQEVRELHAGDGIESDATA